MANNIQADQNSDFFSGVNALLGIKDKNNWKYYHTQQYTYRYVSNTTPVYGVYSHFFDYAAKGTSLIQGQIIILYSAQLEELLKKKLKYNKKNYSPYDGDDIKLLVSNQEALHKEKSILNFRDVLFPGYTRSAAISGEPLTLIIDFIARKTDEYEDIQGIKNLETFISEYEVPISEPNCYSLNNLTSVIYPYSCTFSGVTTEYTPWAFDSKDYNWPELCPIWDEERNTQLYFLNRDYVNTSNITSDFDPDSIDLNDLKGQDSRFIEWKKAIKNTEGIEKYKTDYLNLLNNVKITNEQIILYQWHFDKTSTDSKVEKNRLYKLENDKNPTPEDLEACIIDGDTIKFDADSSIRMLFYNTFETNLGFLENAAAKQQQHYLQILLSRYLARDPYCTDIKLKLSYGKVNPKDTHKRYLGIILLTKTFEIPKYNKNISNFNSLFHYANYINTSDSYADAADIEFKTVKLNFILNMDLLLLTYDQRLTLQIVSDYPQQYFGCNLPNRIEQLLSPIGMWKLQNIHIAAELKFPGVVFVPSNFWKTYPFPLKNPKPLQIPKVVQLEDECPMLISNNISINYKRILNEFYTNKIDFSFQTKDIYFTNTTIYSLYDTYFSQDKEAFHILINDTLNIIIEKLKSLTGEYKGWVLFKNNNFQLLINLTDKKTGTIHILSDSKNKYIIPIISLFKQPYMSKSKYLYNFPMPNYNFTLVKRSFAKKYKQLWKFCEPICLSYNSENTEKFNYTNTDSGEEIYNSLPNNNLLNNLNTKLDVLKKVFYNIQYTENSDAKYSYIALFFKNSPFLFYFQGDLKKYFNYFNEHLTDLFNTYYLWDKESTLLESYFTINYSFEDYMAEQSRINLYKTAHLIIKTDHSVLDTENEPIKLKFIMPNGESLWKTLYKNEKDRVDFAIKLGGSLYLEDNLYVRITKDQIGNNIYDINNNILDKYLNSFSAYYTQKPNKLTSISLPSKDELFELPQLNLKTPSAISNIEVSMGKYNIYSKGFNCESTEIFNIDKLTEDQIPSISVAPLQKNYREIILNIFKVLDDIGAQKSITDEAVRMQQQEYEIDQIELAILDNFSHFYDEIRAIGITNSEAKKFKEDINILIDEQMALLNAHTHLEFFKKFEKFAILFRTKLKEYDPITENISQYIIEFEKITKKYANNNKYLKCYLGESKICFLKPGASYPFTFVILVDSTANALSNIALRDSNNTECNRVLKEILKEFSTKLKDNTISTFKPPFNITEENTKLEKLLGNYRNKNVKIKITPSGADIYLGLKLMNGLNAQ